MAPIAWPLKTFSKRNMRAFGKIKLKECRHEKFSFCFIGVMKKWRAGGPLFLQHNG